MLKSLEFYCRKPKATSRKYLSLFFPLLPVIFASPAFSQQTWVRTYGGSDWDECNDVQQTSDGGYIIAGLTYSFGGGVDDIYLIKTNSLGDTLWTKTYGGSGRDEGYSVQQTSDDGYIITGGTRSFGSGDWDIYLIKTDASGDTLWTKAYGGTDYDKGYSVQQTSDGGYIIAGLTYSFGAGNGDAWLIKTNSSGDTLWTKTFGGLYSDFVYSVMQTLDSGYIIVGVTYSFGTGTGDVWLIKTNAAGGTLWTKTYGGMGDDEGYSARQTSDGGYIISGYTNSFGAGSYDIYLIKTNARGDTLWTGTYGGSADDQGYSVRQTSDGGYIIGGYTSSFGAGGPDIFLIKTDALGDTLWTRTYGGTDMDYGSSAQQTTDGGYIVAGSTRSFGAGWYDVYLIKTDANGRVGMEGSYVPSSAYPFPFSVRPNPFTSFTTVPSHSSERFALYDISGRRVGVYRGDRIGEGLRTGVYFLRAESGKARPLRVVKVR